MKQSDFMPIEKYYALKSVFESLWGKDTYLELKHCSNLRVWKKYAKRTLSASRLAIQSTILITDDDWQKAVDDIVTRSIEKVEMAQHFDDLFDVLSAGYIELSFHQIGLMPRRSLNFRAELRADHWKLDRFRSAQYVQRSEQKKVTK
jgi:hypothetical protein